MFESDGRTGSGRLAAAEAVDENVLPMDASAPIAQSLAAGAKGLTQRRYGLGC